jgi:drug/metabolite transporter (DMT)-like permease
LTEYSFPLLVQFLIAAHIDAGLLSLIVATTPVFTIGFAAIAGTEPLRREVVAACAVGILAMGLIVVPENALPSREMLPWCLAAFLVPVSYSAGTIYVSQHWPEGYDSIQVGFLGALTAAITLAPFSVKALLFSGFSGQTPFAWLMLVALILSLFFELMMYFYLVRHAGPVFTSFSSFVMIVSGFLAGMVIFGERPSTWVWASVALFFISLALVFLPSKVKRKPAPESA